MIEEKAALFALWLGLVCLACALPFGLLTPRFANARTTLSAVTALGWAPALCGLCVLMARGATGIPLMLSLIFAAPLFGQSRQALLGGLAALPLLAATTWWEPGFLWLGWPAALVFVVVGGVATLLPRWMTAKTGLPLAATLAALLVPAAAAAFLTGPFDLARPFRTLWHHWGAYVAPVQALLAGGEPFRDFPVQYGMGPTLAIATFGGQDPWEGIFWATATLNGLYLLVMAACVGLMTRRVARGLALLAMLALAASVLLWTGYPVDFAGTLVTPSVGGLRFLPLALLILTILWDEAGKRAALLGWVVWALSLAWSPEAAVYATIVWFPVLALRAAQAKSADTPGKVARAVFWGAALAVASLVGGVASLALVFRATFGDWPSASGYLVYILHPPGVLPMDLLGPVWLPVSALAIGLVALTRAEASQLRGGVAALLGLLAVSSYYLGRSHSNNVLNLFPFLVLVLTFALSVRLPPMPEAFSRMVLVGLVAWPATFGFESLTAAVREGGIFAGRARLLDRFRRTTPEALQLLDARYADHIGPKALYADANAAVDWLKRQGEEAPVFVNGAMLMLGSGGGPTWTGVNNLANFDPLPRDIVARFIRSGARGFARPGWLLVDRTYPEDWLGLFGVAYVVTEQRDFGGYALYRLAPR